MRPSGAGGALFAFRPLRSGGAGRPGRPALTSGTLGPCRPLAGGEDNEGERRSEEKRHYDAGLLHDVLLVSKASHPKHTHNAVRVRPATLHTVRHWGSLVEYAVLHNSD